MARPYLTVPSSLRSLFLRPMKTARAAPVVAVVLLVAAACLLLAPVPAAAWGDSWWNGGGSSGGSSSDNGGSSPSSSDNERPSDSNGWDGGYTSVGNWRSGRATNYGGPDDYWSIHEGSCGYGYLDDWEATGWDVVAMSDHCDDYSGACGKCYEIKCDPRSFSDGYGQWLDRSSVCYDPEASVIVQVTDSCPCSYPNNAYSNRRWCCGDQYHFDVSTWTFEKLADKKWGVIGLQIRQVPCDTKPYREAPKVSNPSPSNTRISRPSPWWDRRPWFRR